MMMLIDGHPNRGYMIQANLDQGGIDPNLYNQLSRQERKQLANDMSSENGKMRVVNRAQNFLRNKRRRRRFRSQTNLPENKIY